MKAEPKTWLAKASDATEAGVRMEFVSLEAAVMLGLIQVRVATTEIT